MNSLTMGLYVMPFTNESSSCGISGTKAKVTETSTITAKIASILTIEFLDTLSRLLNNPCLIPITRTKLTVVMAARGSSYPTVLMTPIALQ